MAHIQYSEAGQQTLRLLKPNTTDFFLTYIHQIEERTNRIQGFEYNKKAVDELIVKNVVRVADDGSMIVNPNLFYRGEMEKVKQNVLVLLKNQSFA